MNITKILLLTILVFSNVFLEFLIKNLKQLDVSHNRIKLINLSKFKKIYIENLDLSNNLIFNLDFIGKNFVFDERRGERITNDVISLCHQCGRPCDSHVNCANESCHLLFIQCEKCRKKMNNCCSDQCMSITELPHEEQKKIRRGKYNSNKIFKKGRSNKLKYKLS